MSQLLKTYRKRVDTVEIWSNPSVMTCTVFGASCNKVFSNPKKHRKKAKKQSVKILIIPSEFIHLKTGKLHFL